MKCLVHVFLGVGLEALDDTGCGAQFKATHLLLGLSERSSDSGPWKLKEQDPPRWGLW